MENNIVGDALWQSCLLLDIEVTERDALYAVGACRGKEKFSANGQVSAQKLAELEFFAKPTKYLLGHNIIGHDIPHLKSLSPHLSFLEKPAIDTLYLSPLAFPANPYHRLIKDYKIVRESINDPCEDARLAGKIFSEQWQAFKEQHRKNPLVTTLYRSFLAQDPQLRASATALAMMDIPLLKKEALARAFTSFAKSYCCAYAVAEVAERVHLENADNAHLAYVCAWLTVSSGNSVLPPWVRNTFPQISKTLHLLRGRDCEQDDCIHCAKAHNPQYFLQKYWNFNSFRSTPRTTEGESLQKKIVTGAARGETLFATLPTGGGKSLCYLLPAVMRYLHDNSLTIIISPLQALMKDQVDNFSRQTGTKIAAALYGLLTMPERGSLIENIRLGNIAILYISPEQLRNRSLLRAISQRRIGAWVLDEAHCLSKWGHDFRTDYIFAIRFIREFSKSQGQEIPPLQCFTATAKKNVIDEISDIIHNGLNKEMVLYSGGHERDNLHYQVYPVLPHEKMSALLQILTKRFDHKGCVLIYCSSVKGTENLAEALEVEGYAAEAYHARLNNAQKQALLEAFSAGQIPIICATNAFGMGIDKSDIRLVIHYDIPGSLENYLQEAGRAGRDHDPAECILLFGEQDIERQFSLASLSHLSRREISQVLRGVRYAAKGEKEVVITPRELLRQEVVELDENEMFSPDTRVTTAISWLERGNFLQRNFNDTRVFQGRPRVKDLAEAEEKISRLQLSKRNKKRWLEIMTEFISQGDEKGLNADDLASLPSFSREKDELQGPSDTLRVLRTLDDMARAELLNKKTVLTAYIRHKVKSNSEIILTKLCALEKDFVQLLEIHAPYGEDSGQLRLNLRQANQRLLNLGHKDCNPETLKNLLYALQNDGRGLAGKSGSIKISGGGNLFTIHLIRGWQNLKKTLEIRQQVTVVVLAAIQEQVTDKNIRSKQLLVTFSLEEIQKKLEADLLLHPILRDPLAAMERALTFLHEQKIITLQQGLAVFRQAMTLRLADDEGKKRQYLLADFELLGRHYKERTFQIHVMNEYAKRSIDRVGQGMRLVQSYFRDEKEEFINRFFPHNKNSLERATSEQSYAKIVGQLRNRVQEKIVSTNGDKNILVLAGPGAGKTRVVVHRVAYLLRAQRVSPKAILVLCFNRGAVMSLRDRLRELVGADAFGVTTLTFHGLALLLTGRSLAVTSAEQSPKEDHIFSQLIQEAIALLQGKRESLGLDADMAYQTLVGRYSHILVDEYQDIDADQYTLISLLAGMREAEVDKKMHLFAVGDDDQNIYGFRGANVEFIRKFQEDYQAQVYSMLENYRSSAHIIAAANALIGHNHQRMKKGQDIIVDSARKMNPAGGRYQSMDSIGRGRVQILEISHPPAQAESIYREIRRLQRLDRNFDICRCAILSREWKDLDPIRSILEERDISVSLNWAKKKTFPDLSKIRENCILLEYLQQRPQGAIKDYELRQLLAKMEDSIWRQNLKILIEEWLKEYGEQASPISLLQDYLYESLRDQSKNTHLGNGIFLSTIHSVKGLEFDHVFLLADSWEEKRGGDLEEERRLYYVAMSRARETLHLCHYPGPHLHLDLLNGEYLLRRQMAEKGGGTSKRYALLGMDDLFMDYAGILPERHPSRLALAQLQAGSRLHPELREGKIYLLNQDNIPVAALSQTACRLWQRKIALIREVRVIAMVRRYREKILDLGFQSRCHGKMWELPIIEFVSDDESCQGRFPEVRSEELSLANQ